MNTIPKSSWKLSEVYFKAKLVDNFKQKYIDFLLEDSDTYDFDTVGKVVDSWLKRDYVDLYQFPVGGNNLPEDEYDYFERLDHDWVIPRKLFEVMEYKEEEYHGY